MTGASHRQKTYRHSASTGYESDATRMSLRIETASARASSIEGTGGPTQNCSSSFSVSVRVRNCVCIRSRKSVLQRRVEQCIHNNEANGRDDKHNPVLGNLADHRCVARKSWLSSVSATINLYTRLYLSSRRLALTTTGQLNVGSLIPWPVWIWPHASNCHLAYRIVLNSAVEPR
jgi:hypothetical protein